MHLRFSRAIGTPVVDDELHHVLGTLSGIFIHPDTGNIEGFFVHVRGFLSSRQLFLMSPDILRWGERITVAHADALAPFDDHIRLAALDSEGRSILGQLIRTETGRTLGHCRDVQFNTASLQVEWMFPKTLWSWGVPIALSQIIEVRRDAIIVREPSTPAKESVASPVPILNPLEAA